VSICASSVHDEVTEEMRSIPGDAVLQNLNAVSS
jgi:hypothetical protein